MSDLFSVSTVSLHVLSLSFLVEHRYRRSILTLVRLYTSSIVSSSCTTFSEKSRISKTNDSAEPFWDVPLGEKKLDANFHDFCHCNFFWYTKMSCTTSLLLSNLLKFA